MFNIKITLEVWVILKNKTWKIENINFEREDR